VAPKKISNPESSLFPGIVGSSEFNLKKNIDVKSQPSVSDKIVRASVELFITLFTQANALTQKNKLQLIKHFEGHSTVDDITKVTPTIYDKHLKISATCLGLLRVYYIEPE